MDWQQFVMDLESMDPEHVEAVFERHGAHSVTLTDAGENPIFEPSPGATPLWSNTRIAALFSAEVDLAAVTDDLLETFGITALPAHRIELLADREWRLEWLKSFGPMQFGRRLWICPADSTAPPGAVVVRLDPGLAFGTGTHPTTALCLEWLDARLLDDRTLLDFGCGSGILAIAALQLGCRKAAAMDIDPQAVTATRTNATRNAVADRLKVLHDDASIDGQFDVIVANILAGPLVELAQSITSRLATGGELALSGILSNQVNDIEAAYRRWIEFAPAVYRSQNGQTWALMSGRRKNG